MGSVSQMPALFLIAAGLFVISLVVLIAMLWVGRRWLIGPIRQLSKEIHELKAAESQSPLSPQVAADLQESAPTEALAGLETDQVGMDSAKETAFLGVDEVPPDSLREVVTLTDAEKPENTETSKPFLPTRKPDLVRNDIYEMGCLFDEQLAMSLDQVSFQAILYDAGAQHIEIAYPLEQAGSPLEDQRLWSVLHSGQMLQETTPAGDCWLGAPIMEASEVIGALTIYSEQHSSGFAETHQRLLNNLARQAAIILRGLRQPTPCSPPAGQNLSLSSLTRKIWTSTDTDAILRTALEEIGHTFHASGGLIQLEYSFDDVDGQLALTSNGAES